MAKEAVVYREFCLHLTQTFKAAWGRAGEKAMSKHSPFHIYLRALLKVQQKASPSCLGSKQDFLEFGFFSPQKVKITPTS